jgi:hypothetical protein
MTEYEKMYLIPKSLYHVYLQSNSPIKDELSSVHVRQLNNLDVDVNSGGNFTIYNTSKDDTSKFDPTSGSSNLIGDNAKSIEEHNPLRNTVVDTNSIGGRSQSIQLPNGTDDDRNKYQSIQQPQNLPSNVVYNNQVLSANDLLRRNQARSIYAPTYVSSSSSPAYVPSSITHNNYMDELEHEKNENRHDNNAGNSFTQTKATPEADGMDVDNENDNLNMPFPSVSQGAAYNSMQTQTDPRVRRDVDMQTETFNTKHIGSQTDNYMRDLSTQTLKNAIKNAKSQTQNFTKNATSQTQKNATKNIHSQTQNSSQNAHSQTDGGEVHQHIGTQNLNADQVQPVQYRKKVNRSTSPLARNMKVIRGANIHSEQQRMDVTEPSDALSFQQTPSQTKKSLKDKSKKDSLIYIKDKKPYANIPSLKRITGKKKKTNRELNDAYNMDPSNIASSSQADTSVRKESMKNSNVDVDEAMQNLDKARKNEDIHPKRNPMFETKAYNNQDKWNNVLQTRSVNDPRNNVTEDINESNMVSESPEIPYHYANNSLLMESSEPPARKWIPFLNLPKKNSIRSRKSKQSDIPASASRKRQREIEPDIKISKSKEPPKKSFRSRNKKNIDPLNKRNARKRRLEKDDDDDHVYKAFKEPADKKARK